MLVAGAIMYFVMYEMTSDMFISLGVPTEIIYPLAIAKLLGVAALWFIQNKFIKTAAYLGFAIDLTLAVALHLIAGDGSAFGPIIPLVLLATSYFMYRKKSKLA
jgi:hypothetical protein